MLPSRELIVGEDPGSYERFHVGMIAALTPATPYECVIAENLIAIEWELLQHRRMRDASLRHTIHRAICEAVVKQHKAVYETAMEEAWDQHQEAGGGGRTGKILCPSTRRQLRSPARN